MASSITGVIIFKHIFAVQTGSSPAFAFNKEDVRVTLFDLCFSGGWRLFPALKDMHFLLWLGCVSLKQLVLGENAC